MFHIFIIVFLFDFFPDYVMVNSLTKCVLEFSWGLVWVALQCFLNSDGVQNLIEKGYRKISPFFIPYAITNMGAALLAMDVGFMGPNYSISTACATSNYCFYAAANHIRRGEADIIIAGGTEAAIIPIGLGGFVACRALSQRNDDPTTASRPWDKERDGFVMGEGAGVLVWVVTTKFLTP